jgi:ATP-dependent DNA helicase RecG
MVRVSWDSPLSTVTGKATTKVVKETGFGTVGELLGHYPRSYVDRGRLSDLGELTEGDYLSLVGEIVHSEPKSYQDRRTHRTAYRLEVRVRAEDG